MPPPPVKRRSLLEESWEQLMHRPQLVVRNSATQLLLDSTLPHHDEYTVDGQPDDDPRNRTVHSAGLGMKVLKHHDNAHPDKMLEYSAEQVEAHPWRFLTSEVRKASVMAFPSVVRSLLECSLLATIFIFLSVLFEADVMDTLGAVSSTVSAGLFFLLGPYVALCIARWWQMRVEYLGGMWGAIADLNIYAATWFNSGSPADSEARELVLRYSLAAHTLLYKDARGHTSLSDMEDKGLLLPHEAAILKPLPSKSQMVFAWLVDFWSRALRDDRGGLATSPIPHGAMQAPAVIKRCLDGRGAAGGALALVFTQIPFPYVHLLSMLVHVACAINAIVQGAKTGWLLSAPTCVGNASLPENHVPRYEAVDGCPPAFRVHHVAASVMLVLGLLISIMVYAAIYHGLLSVGTMLSNPLGSHFIDFPGSFYQHVIKAECRGFYQCVSAVNVHDAKGTQWWAGVAAHGRMPAMPRASKSE